VKYAHLPSIGNAILLALGVTLTITGAESGGWHWYAGMFFLGYFASSVTRKRA